MKALGRFAPFLVRMGSRLRFFGRPFWSGCGSSIRKLRFVVKAQLCDLAVKAPHCLINAVLVKDSPQPISSLNNLPHTMDPLSIVSGVLSTAIVILKWIQQREAKNESLRELSLTVSRICDILAPLQSPNARMPPNPKSRFTANVVGSVSTDTIPHLDQTIVSCLQDMGETLSSVKEHLSLWKEKRSPAVLLLAFLSPSTVLDQLIADEQKLSRRLVVLSFALQVSTFHSSRGAIPSADPSPLDVIMNTEVRVFWHDRIGPQVSCAPAQSFCRAIGDWLNTLLDKITCDTLLLRLDEYAIGGITPSSLDRFVGSRSIREAIACLGVVQVSPVDVAFESVDPSTVRPLLVWIDDHPENSTREVDYARDLGITVISIRSTAAAKVWIEANEALLRRTESVKRLRFISDNNRWESDQQASDYLNLSAGETMLRYLRGRLYTAPILIYCGASIVRTQYVLSYHRAGSTSDQNVCFSFIGALAQNGPPKHDGDGAEEGQRARALFACLVEIGRTKECLRLAEEYGLREDVEEYTQVWLLMNLKF
ncbi:hypothetical protein A0H81_09916 [Grifola frondosa]|uniref:Uncharacterized protein n=1 Tax=Grifola frondosa TaxID=5627 RepID=A0A1C7M0M1_GRIFR|nr:hypothetical protein A0H81_09916 [Grifola frondosa]